MGFMQKNVNIFLLILVLVVATALAASSVYYQGSFDKINTNYEDTSVELGDCQSDLEGYKFNLNKTLRSLNTTSQDIRRYDELYTTKTEELATTQTTLEETETTLQSTNIQLQEETSLKTKYKKDYQDQLEISRDLEEQNTILTAQKAQLEISVSSYRSELDTAESCIDSFLSDYDAGLTDAMKSDVADCKP